MALDERAEETDRVGKLDIDRWFLFMQRICGFTDDGILEEFESSWLGHSGQGDSGKEGE